MEVGSYLVTLDMPSFANDATIIQLISDRSVASSRRAQLTTRSLREGPGRGICASRVTAVPLSLTLLRDEDGTRRTAHAGEEEDRVEASRVVSANSPDYQIPSGTWRGTGEIAGPDQPI